MYYSNDLISLSVLSIYEGELIGNVDKLYLDKNLKKLIELEVVSGEGVRLRLPVKNIYRIGKNAVTIKNNQAVSVKIDTTELVACPLNSKAYSINGEYLGVIKEFCFNEKFTTEKISLENNATLDVENLAICGKNTLIFNNLSNKVDVKKFTPNKTPKAYKTETEEMVTTMPEPEKEETQIVEVVNNEEFLLGRRCSKDIVNFNNEVLIKANGLVNKTNLKAVKKFKKLRELMLYIK